MHELDDLLFADEKVLWRGAPEPGIHLHKEDLLIIPFSILWSGFAFFWELSVLARNAPLLFQLWGIPFVLAGLYMLIGRFFASAWQARRTSYAVTDRRILMVSRSRHNEIPLTGLPIWSFSGTVAAWAPSFWRQGASISASKTASRRTISVQSAAFAIPNKSIA